MCGQHLWIALTGEDGTNDLHSGHAGQIADDVMELDIHLVQGLLHMLNMSTGITGQVVTLAHVRAQHADLIVRAK